MEDFTELFNEKFGVEVFQTCSNGQVKKRCPECDHKSLSCNILMGVFNCFQCTYSGRLETADKVTNKKIVKKFSQKLQTEILEKILESSELKPSHRKYLSKSGVLYPEKFNIKSIPSTLKLKEVVKEYTDAQLTKSGLYKLGKSGILAPVSALSSDNIIIPYYYNDKLVAAKTRSVILSTISKYKYMCFMESPTADYLYDCTISGKNDLIITEGEKKGIISNSFGFSTCAFGGMSYTKSAVKRLKGLVSKNKIKRLFIILDKDEDFATSISAKSQACKLYEEFNKIACIIFLDQLNPDKVGLDDYLLNYGSEELSFILENTWTYREEEYQKWKLEIQK